MGGRGSFERDRDPHFRPENAPSQGSGAYLPKPSFEKRPAPKAALALAAALILAGAGFAAFKALAPAGGGGAGVLAAADLSRSRVLLLSEADRARTAGPDLGASAQARAAVADGSRALYTIEAWAEEGSGRVEWVSGTTVLASSELGPERRSLTLPLRPGVEQALTVRAREAGAPGLRVRAQAAKGRLRTGVLSAGQSEDWEAAFTGSGS